MTSSLVRHRIEKRIPISGLMPCAALLLHRDRTDKGRFALNALRVRMPLAPLDRGAPSQHGRQVIHKGGVQAGDD
ncbi:MULTISPECIES: hypothetical protein [unclassified Bosea (in: a-proteobacteria)]|uniref:hypothetical protein n=1 Tax=unclassified Bosea (in: a-proteobacteria) TaxID=2653178 RepID=UPI00125FE45E|nr:MULTISPECIES: hypothetical protein [unclassified Bosea (in: a-proteobacteria)]